MDPASKTKPQDDLLAFNSGPQILIEPGLIARGEDPQVGKPLVTGMNPETDLE
jgi:hypothetical protein